jgi:hypothetical protein
MMATVMTSIGPATPDGAPPITGPILLPAFHAAFAVGAVLAAIGSVVALRIHDEDAAGTMQRRRG